MKLSRQEVEHVSLLARVGMSEADIEKFREQLSNILENFDILQQVDTTDVPPTSQAIEMQNVYSEDEVIPSYPPSDVLANAPHQEEGYLKVRAVLE